MSLLLIDDVKKTVETVTNAEWRVIRLLRMLPGGSSEDVQTSLCEQVVDRCTKPNMDESEADRERSAWIRVYLPMAISRAMPRNYGDCFDILLKRSRVIGEMGDLHLMVGSEKAIDAAAETLYREYLRLLAKDECDNYHNNEDDDPSNDGITEATPNQDTGAEDSLEYVFDEMRSVILEWQDRFIQQLEKYVADPLHQVNLPPGA